LAQVSGSVIITEPFAGIGSVGVMLTVTVARLETTLVLLMLQLARVPAVNVTAFSKTGESVAKGL